MSPRAGGIRRRTIAASKHKQVVIKNKFKIKKAFIQIFE